MLLIYSSTHTRTPLHLHLDLIDGEDADALAHILFPPLRADRESLNALLGQVGAVKGTVAFTSSFHPSPHPFHHITTKKKHTVVYHPPGTATHLILVLPPATEPHAQVEQTLLGAWDEFTLRFGPDPWDVPGAVDWWSRWTYQVRGVRHWIAGDDAHTDVRRARGDVVAQVLERIGQHVGARTDAPVVSAYALSPRQTTYTSQPHEEALLHHLRNLSPSTARPRDRTPSATASTKWPALGLGAGPAKPPLTTTPAKAPGGRWPSLSIPGFSRASTLPAPSSTTPPPPPPPPAKAPNNLSAWLGLSAPAPQGQPLPAPPAAEHSPQVVAGKMQDLSDALAEDIHRALSPEWRAEHVWLRPPASSSVAGASEAPRRYALAYTIVGETLVALVLDTLTPLDTLTRQLDQPETPHDGDLDDLPASVRELITCLADVRPPPRPDATSATNTIHVTRSTDGTRLRSSWNAGQLLQPADARAGRTKKRDVTVDQAAGWAKGLFTTIDHARELFARTGDVWIAARAAGAGDEAYVVSRGDEKTSIVDAESMLTRITER